MVQPTSWETDPPRGFRLSLGGAGRRRGSPGIWASRTPGTGLCPSPRRPCSPRVLSPEAPAAPRARLRAPPASRPPLPPFPRRVILGTQSLRGPRRNFSLGWEGGRNPGVLPASPPPGLPGRRGGAAAAPRGLPLGRRAEAQNIPGAGRGVGGGGSPLRPRRVSWKPEPGNRALPSHLLSEGPGGPGSALQTISLPSRSS